MAGCAPYGLVHQSLLEGRINLDQDELWLMLVTNAYVPNLDTHKFKSVVTNEAVASGYSAGGKQITGLTKYYSGKITTVTGSNLDWPSVSLSNVRWGVVYCLRDGVSVTQQPLVCLIDFVTPVNLTNQPFDIVWPASGIVRFAVP